jgi:alpha-galactosidase
LFPAQYGHAKRIACDAWGSISDTEYTMNGLSYGWWLDNVYTYNDPDNIVLSPYSEGENRARVTSAVITGTYMSGDNFSLSGSYPGNATARTKAQKFLTNPDINNIARMGKSFYPVRGYQPSLSRGAESLFMYDAGKYVYVVIFNYTTSSANVSIPMSEIGLDMNTTYSMKELWSGTTGSVSGTLSVTAPMMDAQVYKIDKGNQTGIPDLSVPPNKLTCFVDRQAKSLNISCEDLLTSVDIFSIQGIRILSKSGLNGTHCSITMGSISNGCYLVSAKTAKKETFTTKIIL